MNQDQVSFLPEVLVDSIDDNKKQSFMNDNKLIKIEFTVSACTTDDEYGCRSLDDDDIDYGASVTSPTDNISQDELEIIENYINHNSKINCYDGKYPDISLLGVLEEYDSDIWQNDNVGCASLNGYVWVWII